MYPPPIPLYWEREEKILKGHGCFVLGFGMEMDPHSISCTVQLDSLKNGLPSRKKRATTPFFCKNEIPLYFIWDKLFYLSGGIKTALDVNLISGEKKSKLYFELELEFQSHFQNQPNSYFFFFKP